MRSMKVESVGLIQLSSSLRCLAQRDRILVDP